MKVSWRGFGKCLIFFCKNKGSPFPSNIYGRSRINRTGRALFQAMELLRKKTAAVFSVPVRSHFVIGRFPLAVCKLGKIRYGRRSVDMVFDYGKYPSKYDNSQMEEYFNTGKIEGTNLYEFKTEDAL